MDVRCDKCGTEYEFDEARVGENGVTVKCTNCGHVFRVKRRVPSAPAAASTTPGTREWIVKKPDGQMIAFRELTTLQKWIVEGRINRDDEISRNGETWKRLGNIAELEPFFSVFERAKALNELMATGAIGERPLIVNGSEVLATMSPLSSIVAASSPLPEREQPRISEPTGPPVPVRPPARIQPQSPPVMPPPPRRSVSTVQRASQSVAPRGNRPPSLITRRADLIDEASLNGLAKSDLHHTEPAMPSAGARNLETQQVPRSGRITPPVIQPGGPRLSPPGPKPRTSKPRELSPLPGPAAFSDVGGLSPSGVKRTSAAEAEEIVNGFQKKRRRRTATALLGGFMVLGLGGGAALATMGPEENPLRRFVQSIGLLPPPQPAGPDRASELIEAARRAHELDRLETLQEADQELTEALSLRNDAPSVRADLALVLTTWADMLRRRAALDDAKAAATSGPESVTLTAGAEGGRSQASALMKRAFELVRTAYEKDPGGLAPSRALADYYRVQRDTSGRFAQLLAQARAAAQAAGTTDAATAYVEAAQLAREPSTAATAELERATTLLEDAVTTRPTLVRARVLLARIAIARGQLDAAKGELDRALAASPGHQEAMALLASLAPPPAPSATPEPTPTAAAASPSPSPTPEPSPTPTPVATPVASVVPSPTPATSPPPSPSAAPIASASPRATPSPSASSDAVPVPTPINKAAPPAAKSYDGLLKQADKLRERGEAWEALLSYEKATGLRPDAGRALAGMGWCYMDLGKPEAALHQFRRAIAHEPGYPDSHLGHAEAYRALGNGDKAIGSYKRYLDLKPTGSGAESAKRGIQALQGSAKAPAPDKTEDAPETPDVP